MDSPIILLAVLNSLPNTLPQILAEIADLRHGRSVSPFGGSSSIGRFVREIDGQPGPLEPFHTRESCEQGLQKLVDFGFVKKDGSGYRLTYEGVVATPGIIRHLEKRYWAGCRGALPAARETASKPKPELSPSSQQRMIRDYRDRYTPRWKK